MKTVHEATPFSVESISALGQIALGVKEKNDKNRKVYLDKNVPNLGGSISNKAKNLVMTFPTLCDNSLPPATASMISRANERNIVTMFQLLFASMSLRGSDGVEILSRIHKNINFNKSMDDIIDDIDDILDDYGTYRESVSVAECKRILREMADSLKLPQKSYPINSFSERSLNDYTIFNIHGQTVVKEDSSTNPFLLFDDQIMSIDDPAKLDLYISKLKARGLKNDQIDQIIQNARKEMEDKNRTTKALYDMQNDALQRRLLDNDVKKANELVPTLMVVNYNEVDEYGKIHAQRPFVAGVKSRLIPVDSSDIIDRITVKNKTKVNFLNLIRATTGEIGLVKDFLLCLDQAKIDAKNSVKKGQAAQMWRLLEDRAIKNKRKFSKTGNDASAITTLVINQETVNFLKKEHDFDIEKISNTRQIMDAYNLMGIVIVDESIEVAKFFYAGNDSYEQLAFSYLEKESNDNSYKKVINLIGKMNGR